MNKTQVLSLVRHTLTFVGGILIAHGVVEESIIEQIVATTMTLAGLIWGVVEKKKGV